MVAFYKFIDYTDTLIENGIRFDNVPLIDYPEFIRSLNDLYYGDIPDDAIEDTAKFITGFIDLSEFTPDFIETIFNSPNFKLDRDKRQEFYNHLVGKGYIYDEIANKRDKYTAMLTKDIYGAVFRGENLILQIVGDDYNVINGFEAKGENSTIAIMIPFTVIKDRVSVDDIVRIIKYDDIGDEHTINLIVNEYELLT